MLLLFKRLFTELDVYIELSAQRFRSVLSVFLVGLFVLAFVNGIAVSFTQGPQFILSLKEMSVKLVNWWSTNQIGHWREGQLSFSPTPTENKIIGWPIAPPDHLTRHLAVYSPNAITQPDANFSGGSENTLFVLSPTHFWVNQLNGQWSTPLPLTDFPGLSELPSGDYTQATFADEVGKAHASIRQALIGLLILWPVLSVLGTWISMAWFVVTEALFVWLITKLFGWKLNWVRLAKLNCLLVIPAATLQYLASWLYPEMTLSLFHVTYWILLSLLLLVGSQELEKATT